MKYLLFNGNVVLRKENIMSGALIEIIEPLEKGGKRRTGIIKEWKYNRLPMINIETISEWFSLGEIDASLVALSMIDNATYREVILREDNEKYCREFIKHFKSGVRSGPILVAQ